MRRSNYYFDGAACDDARVVLVDAGPWDQYPTITNNAEGVISELGSTIYGKRLFYYDSEGDYSELLHDGVGNFIGFAPA